jgi:hypothetical protein
LYATRLSGRKPDTTTKSAPRLHFFDPATLKDVKAVDMP